MKNLIYLPALLCAMIFITSCTKNDSLSPAKKLPAADSVTEILPKKANCDTIKMVSYLLTNTTGITSFEVGFFGAKIYTFTFPANGSKVVSVQSGTYIIQIPSTGNYVSHDFYLEGSPAISEGPTSVKASGAKFNGVQISPCDAGLGVTIR